MSLCERPRVARLFPYPLSPVLTIQDLLAYGSKHASISGSNYAGCSQAWNRDRARRDSQRRRVFRRWAVRVRGSEPLVAGRYGRLTITAAGIDYVPGHYAAMELWAAIDAYLEATN